MPGLTPLEPRHAKTALILLTPCELASSFWILNRHFPSGPASSLVLATCGPPQNSFEYADARLSPMKYIEISSPYFSPKKCRAPVFSACSRGKVT